ncbi:PIG-L family deacetylase [Microbispora sp. NEAU-D428]|uniref:PIG-L deacetylase family protein n=1 Tax=Microbispora sitophila TaxID=2771537 RepID=UPI001867C31E|nr:PIG-L deacetylase family protein [Microbispora sitophila]MBE3013934.1 PIG-L family deacetylase [Microbispora sitophila]
MSDELQPMPDDWSTALAVVAHPDDIEFGAAGAVATWTAAGKSVSYLLLTRGEAGIDGMPPEEAAAVREAEQRESASIVGVDSVTFLDYADGVVEYGLPLRRRLAEEIRRHRPELVIGFNHHDRFLSGRWNPPDHRNTGRALLDAVGDAGNRWIFRDLGLEPWQGVRHVAIANSPHPTHAVDVTDAIDKAVASLEAHRAYLAGLRPPVTDVRGPLTAMARQTGERFGGRLAIAFELIPR